MDPSESWLQKYRIPIALSLLGIVLIIGGIFASGINKSESLSSNQKSFPKESLVGSQDVTVDISGSVNMPGIYKLKIGDRVADAINLAGGFKDSANKEYISKYLNLAQKVADGTKIYIPYQGEQYTNTQAGSVAGVSSTAAGNVNINTASQSDLEALTGIGPVTASKIISSRPYQATDDLVSKKIISKSVFDKIKDSISI